MDFMCLQCTATGNAVRRHEFVSVSSSLDGRLAVTSMAMKLFCLLVVSIPLVVAAPTLRSAPTDGYLRGQVSGLQRPDLGVVDLRIRFYAQRSGGEPLGERFFPSVELLQGRFSIALDTVPARRSLLFVEVGLRPSGRHYALFTTLAPRRRLRPGNTSLVFWPATTGETPGLKSELLVIVRSHVQASS